MNPTISVIVPVYNVEKYLRVCCDSLMNQTYQGIEYIFINDASTYGSIRILMEYKKRYPDLVNVIDLPESLCQGGARNTGIRAARGEWIGFCDSDDFVSRDMFQRLYEAVCGVDVDVAFTRMTSVTEDSDMADRHVVHSYPFAPFLIENERRDLKDDERERLICTGTGQAVRKLTSPDSGA